MTLDAGVAGVHVIEARRIENIVAGRLFGMGLTRTVTPFAPNIPLGDGLRVDVVIHGMTAVAERPRGPLEIVRRIERRPPIGAVGDEIAAPALMGDVPLSGQRKVIIANFFEVPLLPPAAVNQ